MSAIDPEKELPATLAEAAKQFLPVVKAREMLEKHRDSILLLRARGASYASIIQLLKSYGVTVSDLTLMRFCRQNGAEIRRIRAKDALSTSETGELSQSSTVRSGESNTESHVPPPAAIPLKPTTPANTMRSLRGKV